jgi:hypothetical protein
MLKFKYFDPDSFPKMGRILLIALERMQGRKSRLNVIEITISEGARDDQHCQGQATFGSATTPTFFPKWDCFVRNPLD